MDFNIRNGLQSPYKPIKKQKMKSLTFESQKAIQNYIDRFGIEFTNVDRIVATAKNIMEVDRLTEKNDLQAVFEAINYESSYYENFYDLKSCIKKGGIERNMLCINRMIEVGIELPEEIINQIK